MHLSICADVVILPQAGVTVHVVTVHVVPMFVTVHVVTVLALAK